MLWHLRSEDESVGESWGLYLSTSPQQPEGLTDRLLHFVSLTILLISASACSGDQCHNFVATVGPFHMRAKTMFVTGSEEIGVANSETAVAEVDVSCLP